MASIQIKDSCLTKDNFLKIQKENAKNKRKEDAKHQIYINYLKYISAIPKP